MIGTKLYKGKFTNKEYADEAVWAKSHNAYISDEGEYYETKVIEKHEPTNEEISNIRKAVFTEEADPLKYDWEEQSARYGVSSPQAIQAKNIWLMKKDEIRERYPYNEEK